MCQDAGSEAGVAAPPALVSSARGPVALAAFGPPAGPVPAAIAVAARVPAAFAPATSAAAACAIRPPAWAMSGTGGRGSVARPASLMPAAQWVFVNASTIVGIELDPGELPELGHRLLTRQRLHAVRARGRHGLEGVGHVEDPGQDRDLVAHQAVGVAGAVVPLVVVPNDRELGGQLRHWGDDVRADHRVGVHDRALFPRQAVRLVQHAVRNADLPDVVEQPTPLQGLELLLGQPHHAPDVHRDQLDPLAVAGRPVVLASTACARLATVWVNICRISMILVEERPA